MLFWLIFDVDERSLDIFMTFDSRCRAILQSHTVVMQDAPPLPLLDGSFRLMVFIGELFRLPRKL